MVKMQFCVECGTPNEMTARYCVKCQTLLVLTIASVEKAPRLPWSLRKKLIVIGSPILALALIIIAAAPKPSPITVDITVEAPHGGIFDESCNLTESARSIGATDAEVVDYGAAAGSGTKTALVFKQAGGSCVATANLNLLNGNYEIYVAGKLAGDITPEDIAAGVAAKSLPLEVSHEIKGTIVLSTHYSGCKNKTDGTGCTASISTPVRINVKDNFCYGQVALADITQKGSPITVVGVGTKLTATGKLGKGMPAIEDLKTGRATCTYDFTISDVIHDDSGYKIFVGSKKHQTELVKVSALEASGWVYEYEFKR